VNSLENDNVLYKLELKYKGKNGKISFMEDGIRIPIFLAKYILGSKINFFQKKNIIERSNDFYFLKYECGFEFELMAEKNLRKQTYSLYLKSTIEPTLRPILRTLLKIWRGKKQYIIFSLKNLQYESLVKIYDLLDTIQTIDKIRLEDVELNAQLANEAMYSAPFVLYCLSGLFCSFVSLILMDLLSNEFNTVKIFLWIFNPSYTVFNMVGIVVYGSKKSKSKTFLKKVKRFHILSGLVFLLVNLSVFIFAYNQ
jgi:hypothetical protein